MIKYPRFLVIIDTYVVATLKRDEMLSEGRDDELETIIQAGRDSQADLVGETSQSGK